MKKEFVIYQGKNGEIAFKGDVKKETIWASQAQIVALFDVDQSVVSRHIKNVFKDGEISEKSNMQKMHIANSDKPVVLYSLDVILAVGYRTNSKVAIGFRKWATKTLRTYLTQGFIIHPKQIAKNHEVFLQAVESVRKLLPSGGQIKAEDALELVKFFANTWVSLDAYDKSTLPQKGVSKKQVRITGHELSTAITALKRDLLKKGEATNLFAQERSRDAVEGIVGNVFQTVFGKDVYPTLEEKAAHLLYFIVKNHPFSDGNKRSGAFSFVWFLSRVGLLRTDRLTPEALTTLTLLVAESNPKEKERMIGLILLMLKQ
jgi:prophage maintenance system killer protein